jgi:hypothetical protein
MNPNKIPTPRTNALKHRLNYDEICVEDIFQECAKMERELFQAKEEIERLDMIIAEHLAHNRRRLRWS